MEVKKGLSQGRPACAWITVKKSVLIMVCSTQDGHWICVEHFVMLEMMHELVCAGGTKWLETGDQKALRATHGSQRLLMSGKPSMCATSPRRAHVHDCPFSVEESEAPCRDAGVGAARSECQDWVGSRRLCPMRRRGTLVSGSVLAQDNQISCPLGHSIGRPSLGEGRGPKGRVWTFEVVHVLKTHIS